jgi:hypothetical protein
MDDNGTPSEKMTLTLRGLHGGAYTQLALTGPMATVPQGKELRRLFALLSFWHGGPVDVVLCIAMDTAGWLEIWDEALAAVSKRHVRIRITRDTPLGRNGSG